MNITINPAPMYPILAVILLIFLYGLYVAIRLFMRAEWQWLCLHFIVLPTVLFYAVVLKMKHDDPFLVHLTYETTVFGSLYFLYVSLSSGFGVYWLMNKYRQQTAFINCYAFYYFSNVFALIGCLSSVGSLSKIGVSFFLGLLKLLPLYGIALLILSVYIMDYRLCELKEKDIE